MDTAALRARIEEHVRSHELIEPGGEVCCLVSGGADSTCLWHALRELGYRVSALHVNHKLRGAESDEPGLEVRRWRAGDRLAGRSKKIQDVFVDAKIPRSQRANYPLVVRGEEVVAVPGVVEDSTVRVTRE